MPAPPTVSLYLGAYSSAYNDELVRQLPYVPYFAERCLCHLGLLVDPGNRVVLVTPTSLPDNLIAYHLRDVLGLNAEGEASARERLILLNSPAGGPESLAVRMLEEPELLQRLRHEVGRAGRALLINVAPSGEIEELGAALGVEVEEGPPGPAGDWGSKAGNKQLLSAAGVPTVRTGDQVLRSVKEVVSEAIRLASHSTGPARALVKLNHPGWSAGMGNALIDCDKLAEGASLEGCLTALRIPWPVFESEIIRSGAVVEEFATGVTSSPSGQGTIGRDGTVTLRAVHQQLLDGGHFLGSTYPCRERLQNRIAGAMDRIGRALADKGVRGTFGVDFVEVESGRLIAVEINIRKLGTNHVMSYVEAATGDKLAPFGHLERSGRPISYVHRRLFRPAELTGLAISKAIEAVRGAGVLWSRERGEGTVLHILGALPACGYVEMVTIAEHLERAHELDRRAEQALIRRS